MRTIFRLSAVALAAFATAFTAAPVNAQGFGSGVAVHGPHAVIGERGGPTSPGAVYLYQRSGSAWEIMTTLVPEGAENGAGFGSSVAVSGNRILVGANGTAYVFEPGSGGWSQTGMLSAMTAEGLSFGGNVALQDDRALVSATAGRRFGPGGGADGEVHVFDRDENGNWNPAGTLSAAGATGFGSSMALRGDYAVVGAPMAEVGSARAAGSVYVFNRGEDGTWSQVGDALVAPDASQAAQFGAAVYPHVTDDGVTMFVAAPGAAGFAGAVYAFANDAGAWVPEALFLPPVTQVASGRRRGGGGFGSAIEVVGDELWIGSGSGFNQYSKSDSGWTLTGSVASEGSQVAFGSDFAVVGAPGKDYGMGSAFFLERDGDDWASVAEVYSEPSNYTAVIGDEVTCEDGMASEFECSEIDILSYVPVSQLGAARGVRTNDVWGWTDPQTGREYALVGMTDQASFMDITDANNPRYVGRLMMTEGARGSTWRDIKVYDNHAFIVSDGAGEHGMQIFDLTRLRDVGSEAVDFDMDAHYDGIASAHNIVINEETGFAYSVGSSGGGETCGGGLHMIDIRNPTEPAFAGCFADTSTGRQNTGYSHDAMCINYEGPDSDYDGKEICFGSNETAISIADVTDKDNAVAISTATYPRVGYAHQGWITDDHRFFYLGDELDEIQQAGGENPFPGTRTMIWDVSDLDDPVFVGEHFGVSTASDHNLYIIDGLMYQSNYNSGLRILDVSDPENPTEVAYFDTVPHAEGPSMGGSWSNYPYFESGTIIVTSGSEGLFLLKHRKEELVP
jgi:choice-of-anchor B domain-containing protein